MGLPCRAALKFLITYYLYGILPFLVSMFTYAKRSAEPLVADDEGRSKLSEPEKDSPSTLYALVIGIDTYLNQPHLAGAASDADKMSEFLINDLGTPPSQIIGLRNAAATRENIIRAFRRLQTEPHIKSGFPILIYFAGHGGVASRKGFHTAINKTQVIFPYDYGERYGEQKVNYIKDTEVADWLNKLAEAKGNNITVIFDSCHSASGSRSSLAVGDRLARCAKAESDTTPYIDDDTRMSLSAALSATRNISSPFCTHQTSHIHLAACGSNEYAWEESGRGRFTTALLKAMREWGVNEVTYRNLVLGLPRLPDQTPHCYGAYKNRTLFSGCVTPRKTAYIPVIYDSGSETVLTLQAGTASGVTHNSVWELRAYPTSGDQESIGTVTAGLPGVSRTELRNGEGDRTFWERCRSGTPYEGQKIKLYARLLESGPGSELKVWFSLEAKRIIFSQAGGNLPESHGRIAHEFGYVVHPVEDSADMTVSVYNPTEHPSSPGSTLPGMVEKEVEFRLHNPTAQKYGVATLLQRVLARQAEVETVLFAAARWHWYLKQTNPDHVSDLVGMEMFKIAERPKDAGGGYSATRRQKIPAREWVNLDVEPEGVVKFDVHEKDLYGVRVTSRMDRPLYVQMFYFDTTSFVIENQSGHTSANGRADHDLDPGGEFIIGDDKEGGTPLPFKLDDEQKLDVGFLKLFWSTDPLELQNAEQESAFEMKAGRQGRKVTVARRGFQKSAWGTTTLALVQRKPPCQKT